MDKRPLEFLKALNVQWACSRLFIQKNPLQFTLNIFSIYGTFSGAFAGAAELDEVVDKTGSFFAKVSELDVVSADASNAREQHLSSKAEATIGLFNSVGDCESSVSLTQGCVHKEMSFLRRLFMPPCCFLGVLQSECGHKEI